MYIVQMGGTNRTGMLSCLCKHLTFNVKPVILGVTIIYVGLQIKSRYKLQSDRFAT